MTRQDFDIRALSDAELEGFLRELIAEVAQSKALIEPARMLRKRTMRVIRGTILTFAGLMFAVPTNGISMLLFLAGFLDWVQTISDDSAAMNLQIALTRAHREQSTLLEAVIAEYERRQA